MSGANCVFSIIMPHYNIPNLLERCLKSIPVRDDLEVIVIDDSSTKDVLKRLKEIRRRYSFRLFINLDKKGAGNCRNIGLKKARGKWLIFADSDDFFSSDFNYILDKYKDNQCDIIYFNIRSVLSDNTHICSFRSNDKNRLFKLYAKSGGSKQIIGKFRFGYPEPWGKMIKRKLVESNKIVFDDTLVCNDFMFSFLIGLNAKSILCIDEVMYVLTLRANSLSNNYSDSLKKMDIRLDVLLRVIALCRKYSINTSLLPVKVEEILYLYMRFYPKLFLDKVRCVHKSLGISYIYIVFFLIIFLLNKLVLKIYGCLNYNN